MATINNSKVTKRLIDDAQIQLSVDRIPTQLAEKVVPVLLVSPPEISTKVFENENSTTSSVVIGSIDAKSDFIITSVQANYTSDATSDNTGGYIEVTTENRTVKLLRHTKQTATAGTQNYILSFPKGFKVDAGSSIRLYGSFTTGATTKQAVITGYYVRN